MDLHARLLHRGCVPGLPRICRQAPFLGLTSRCRPLGLAGRRRRPQVRGSTPPYSGWLCRPTPSTLMEAARFLQPLADGDLPAPRRHCPGRSYSSSSPACGSPPCRRFSSSGEAQEKEGKKEIIYINLLSSIGNPKYLMRKAPMEKDGKSEFKREIIYTTCRSA
ncbi:uncharacterized protein [Aegilops tauschii subsp. strangulata]|uniref:uncharacterized protein n=1 Tax=Aegilops tauschii subsp. strangulata TaxID=200361 RepID=UPI00098A3945|nr:uncharacterized protein LOC123052060 isoform X2 [Triticum aestivum]XP_045088697.1 uncharacterized protein LOC109776727 isoform X2 [Aegilops tauschii subsp. strangulata]